MTAPPGRDRAWRVWAAASAIAFVAAAIHAAANRGEVLSPLSDEALLLPIALRQADPSLYPGDTWLATTAGVFSVAYSWLIAALLSFIDDPIAALRLLSIPAHAVLIAGTWRLAERFGGRAAAVAATLLVALPPCSVIVFAPGAALPRDLVFAALPWLTLALVDAPSPRRAVVVFGALGLLANLHPLTGLHFAALFLVVGLVLDPTPRGAAACAVRGVAFAVGASPYAAQYLARPAAVGDVDPAVYAWRLPEMAGESVGAWAARMEPAIWLGAAAAVLAVAARRLGATPPRALVVVLVVSFAFAALGPTIGRLAPPLRAVQLARFERVSDWCAVVVAAVCLATAWRARAFAAVSAALACVAASTIQAGAFDDAPGPRGPIARVGRLIDRGAGVPFARPVPPALRPRTDVVDPTSPDNREAFLAVCRFAREETAEDALFLVPPEHWGPFRVYARRGVFVTRKEGGAALSFLGAQGARWFDDYSAAVEAYAAGDQGRLGAFAEQRGADYVVADPGTIPPPWPLVLSAGKFRVFDARRK